MTDTYGDKVVLLLHMEGSNNGTVFSDSSLFGLTSSTSPFGPATHLEPIFNAVTSTTEKLFGTSSYWSGVGGGALRVIDNNSINALPAWYDIPVGEDFTIEAAFWQATASVFYSAPLFSMGSFANGAHIFLEFGLNVTSGIPYAIARQSDGTTTVISLAGSTNCCDGTWHRVALQRTGHRYDLYVDGVVEATGTNSGDIGITLSDISIGRSAGSSGSGLLQDGYIDEVRYTKGVARYSGTYTPAAAAFEDPTADTCDDDYTNVSLLLHFEGNFTDASSLNHTMTPTNVSAAGPALIGTSSMLNIGAYYNATLTTPIDTSLDLSAVDTTSWTVEFWYRPSSADLAGGYPPVLFDMTDNATTGFFIQVSLDPAFKVQVYGAGGGGQPAGFGDSTVLIADRPYHIALVMDATAHEMAFYIDGHTFGAQSVTVAWGIPFGGNLRIGGSFGVGPTGNIDEVRVTKGVARYTGNFVIPPAPFPDNICGPPPPPGGTIFVYGTFVPSSDFKAIEMNRLGSIKPKIYAPVPNRIARTRP